ncbi:MAG TPA: hypothetical protein VKB80_29490 [Kofleriaceae bacterium]|nr:hypothetical protein [Kofleriaceae bacterium]
MQFSTVVAPLGARALLLAALSLAGCTGYIDAPPDLDDGSMVPGAPGGGDGEPGGADPGDADDPGDAGDPPSDACALGAPGVYSPFATAGGYPSGTAGELPWSGAAASPDALDYPSGDEDFSGYGPDLPNNVECSDDKGRRPYLDVTAGCLDAVAVGSSAYTRGLIGTTSDGYFRALALGYAPADSSHPIKWTDQSVSYRFFHHGRTGDEGNPGFKAFARYRSEDDLYVASWRFDGVVQIQRKLCGEYTALAVIKDFGPPSPDVWHSIRFDAVGEELSLYLDDDLVLTTTSGSLSWGTAGIRIDSADGAYIDDWSVD